MTDHSNQLFIEDALDDDNSVVRLSSQTMDKLQLFCGDAVKLKGKRRRERETICMVLADDSCRDDHIRMNTVVRNNLRLHVGDLVSVLECQDIKYGIRIDVLPIDDNVKDISGDLLKEYLQPYFRDAFRPVYVGDTFIVRTALSVVEFKVIKTEPSRYCIVAPETMIYCEGEPIEREVEEVLNYEIDFDDIDGLEDIKKDLKETVLSLMEYQEPCAGFRSGISPSRGIFLYGPPGCGKTMLVRALANECDINVICIKSPELLATSFDDREGNLRNIFDRARQNAPCILLIDELDYLFKTSDRNSTFETVSADRLINQLLTEIDGMRFKTKVLMIGTTNRPEMIDRTFLRPGRFDQMVYVPFPDEKSRQAILKIVLKDWSVAADVDLTVFARYLFGSSGADIVELCRRACKAAIREAIDKDSKEEQLNLCVDLKVEIQRNHFEQMMRLFPHLVAPNYDIRKYDMFAQIRQSFYTFNSSFQMPVNTGNSHEDDRVKQEQNVYTDDDDLYG